MDGNIIHIVDLAWGKSTGYGEPLTFSLLAVCATRQTNSGVACDFRWHGIHVISL